MVDDVLADRAFVEERRTSAAELGTLDDVQGDSPVLAPHQVSNALAAAALARAAGVPPAAVRNGLRGFRPDPHRIAHVATVDGVTWVDDSKATNPPAAAASLAAFEHVVWVAGGLLKGADVDDLVRVHAPPAARRRADRPRPGPDRPGDRATRARCPGRRGRPDGDWAHGRRRAPRRRVWRTPATPCCSPRRRRRWTCSATTPSAGRSSPPPSTGSLGHGRGSSA